jgi:para-nitrobenzyl esterase
VNRTFSLLTLGCLLATATLPAVTDAVKTESGSVAGASDKDSTVRIYKGIPYAAPPVGELRWKAPQPAPKWEGVRMADQFGNVCTAGGAGGRGRAGQGQGGQARGGAPKDNPDQAKAVPTPGRGPAGPSASEDCLYINVWTPAKSANDKLPVFVWTYGGGFTGGSGSDSWYDGETLAKKGIIVVTYNYRLGMFGFFAHPDLTAEDTHHTSGNHGMMDWLAALHWVQENIAAFGGDPRKVTIGGESAGAIMVANTVASPQAKGLFIRAIGQSGAWMGLSITKMRTLAQAQEAGKRAAGTHTIAELRAMSTQELGQNLRGVQAGIIVDGYLLPEDQTITYTKGKQLDVDILVGSNQDEGTFFQRGGVTAEQAQNDAKRAYGDLAPEFLKLWPASTDAEAATSGLARSRDEVGWHMRTWAELQTKKGNKAYLYYFTHVPPGNGARGATHTAEISYMNGNPRGVAWTDEDKKLSEVMTSYWANFVVTGDPNRKGLPKWEAYNSKSNDGRAMVLGDTVEFGPQIGVPRLEFFDKFYAIEQKQ